MNQAMSQEQLEKVFDQVAREVTQRESGIRLLEGGSRPEGEICTVYTTFQQCCQTGLSLCADRALFTRLTQGMMQEEEVSDQDVEDFTKEYFNVLCGRILSEMYLKTKIAARFEPPSFCQGRCAPHGHQEQFSLQYTSEGAGNAELVYLRGAAAEGLSKQKGVKDAL